MTSDFRPFVMFFARKKKEKAEYPQKARENIENKVGDGIMPGIWNLEELS